MKSNTELCIAVSVIIAAYNADKYLAETLESVVRQSIVETEKMEVFLINDGSTDSTREIAERYAERYPYIKVINRENAGPSAARNVGLKMAAGKYLFFLDADDLLDPHALEFMYRRAENTDADLIIAQYDIFDEYKSYEINNISALVSEDEISRHDKRILLTFALWNKLFRRDIITKNQLKFPPISYSEDGVFVMNYVYRCSKIVGLLDVVLHYRRMREIGNTAITASISEGKIDDYVEAHRLIYEAAKKSLDGENLLETYEAVSETEDIKPGYMSYILWKELNVLIGQFYAKFWDLNETCICKITQEVKKQLPRLSVGDYASLIGQFSEYRLQDLIDSKSKMREETQITGVLYAEEGDEEKLFTWLASFISQTMVSIQLILPEKLRRCVESSRYKRENIGYMDAGSETELYEKAYEQVKSRYIIFCQIDTIYVSNAWKTFYHQMISEKSDFTVNIVHHINYGDNQTVTLNSDSIKEITNWGRYNEYLAFDSFWANKLFDKRFLEQMHISFRNDRLEQIAKIYKRGYYRILTGVYTLFQAPEEYFLDIIRSEGNAPVIERYLYGEKGDLGASFIDEDFHKQKFLLLGLPCKGIRDRIKISVVKRIRKCAVQDKVLFYSIRSNGKLEGNMAALYPYVEGKKVIVAHKLPHNLLRELWGVYQTVTSRVIITDDYERYLVHVPLRKEQRVVQLWHACGAFKKFGRRGTNISVKADRAMHAQYSVVCVSGQYIRSIYADAFDINVRKVQDLGCPRTDRFLDAAALEETKEQVYQKYPQMRDKDVILYAPTFRDEKGDRTVFEPELDFGELSQRLKENQLFVLCPHPLMKNKIVPEQYENILELRDVTTNDMMPVSKMMITDYSSVIFEYALLGKPIIFYCYDLQEYSRGFYLNYPEDLPGEVFTEQAPLLDYLTGEQEPVIDQRYNQFLERYMSACDGKSGQRIGNMINNYMRREK